MFSVFNRFKSIYRSFHTFICRQLFQTSDPHQYSAINKKNSLKNRRIAAAYETSCLYMRTVQLNFRNLVIYSWLRNSLSYLQSQKYLCIFIRDMFNKKILSHIFFQSISKIKNTKSNC